MNIIAIIQARMGSTRLPGKVMMHIEGKPMLGHVIDRAKQSQVDDVIVATSRKKRDDIIVQYCIQEGIKYYRGSEDDVLDRYYRAAKVVNADAIVRITSDCPLISPQVVNQCIQKMRFGRVDFVSSVIKRTYPRGLDTEIITFELLKKLFDITKEPSHREHVTLYIYENIDSFSTINIENDFDASFMQWSVDTQEDLDRVRDIYKKLKDK